MLVNQCYCAFEPFAMRQTQSAMNKIPIVRTPLYVRVLLKKPTRCTILLSIFISTSVHVSGNYVPIIRRTYCIFATLVFFNVWVAVWSAEG